MSVANIKSAVKGYSSHRYNPITIASLDYDDLVPVRVIECIKGDNFTDIKGSGFLRLAPTIFPAYGRCKLNTAAFFVPESQLIQQSDAFHANQKTYKGRAVVYPHTNGYNINECFYLNSYLVDSTHPFDFTSDFLSARVGDTSIGITDAYIDSLEYDFTYPFGTAASGYKVGFYRLTHRGRRLYKILKALGFDFCSFPLTQQTWISLDDVVAYGRYTINIMPLLAYAKIWTDMFCNAHLYNSDLLVNLLKCVHDAEAWSSTDSSVPSGASYTTSGFMNSPCLLFILYHIMVPFSHNMYLDAWNSPNSPDGVSPESDMIDSNVPNGIISPILPSPSSSSDSTIIRNDSNGSFIRNINTSESVVSMTFLSEYGLHWLDSFFKFVRRRGLFGSKAFERLFALFGIKSSDYNHNFVNKIYEGSSDLDFSAVLSQTDSYNPSTDLGKHLGSYAGYGAAGFNFQFSHKCDSFGYIIVLSWVDMIPLKVSGISPSVLRTSPLDFYNPDWDGKTIRAIPMCELGTTKRLQQLTSSDKNIYGYTDIYDDYREIQDTVIGDFVLDKNVKDFVFSRDLGWFRTGMRPSPKPQYNFIQYMAALRGDISNPFQWLPNEGDRFYLEFKIDISAKRPILSKSAALDLDGEGDVSIQIGGSQIR